MGSVMVESRKKMVKIAKSQAYSNPALARFESLKHHAEIYVAIGEATVSERASEQANNALYYGFHT